MMGKQIMAFQPQELGGEYAASLLNDFRDREPTIVVECRERPEVGR
jgi:hypothetical protein